jgi:hypothetical protein
MFVAHLSLMRALGWRTLVAQALGYLAYVARAQGDYQEATACYAEALTLYRHIGDHQSTTVAWVLSRLAAVALEQGEWAVAQTHLAESLALAQDARHDALREIADPPEVRAALAADDPAGLSSFTATVLPGTLETQAAVAAVQGTPDRALRLAGAAAALRSRLNRPLAPAEQATLERRLAPARQALSAEQQATAWAGGQAMTHEQAIADALMGLPSERGPQLPKPPERQRAATRKPPTQRLSRTERQTWVMQHLRMVGSVSPREYVAALGVERRTAVRDLRALAERGVVVAQGTTTDRRYVLPPESP